MVPPVYIEELYELAATTTDSFVSVGQPNTVANTSGRELRIVASPKIYAHQKTGTTGSLCGLELSQAEVPSARIYSGQSGTELSLTDSP